MLCYFGNPQTSIESRINIRVFPHRLTLSIDCDFCPFGQATNGSVNRKGIENIWQQHLDQYKKVCDIRSCKRITTVSMVIGGLLDVGNVKMLFSVDLAIDINIMCWEEQIYLLNSWVVSYLSVLILFSEFVCILYSRVLWTSTSAVYSTGWWDTTFQQHVVHFLNLILLLVIIIIIIPKGPLARGCITSFHYWFIGEWPQLYHRLLRFCWIEYKVKGQLTDP